LDKWQTLLQTADTDDAAWDDFIESYRALIAATIRHLITGEEAVTEAFTHICATLSADRMARLRAFDDRPQHTAQFSSWLVVVVRNQTVDWLRRQHGRRRVAVPNGLTQVEAEIFELVFVQGASHNETFERLRSGGYPQLSFSAFLKHLRIVYRTRTRRSTLPRRQLSLTQSLTDESPMIDELIETAQLNARVQQAIQSLPAAEALAVQLFIVDDMPASEVARVVGWPNAKTVYNHVYRALARVREQLEVRAQDA
jgi:RNA polymerase sigma factor (sigma-70 family)